MTQVMKQAIDLDEKLVNENEEKLQSLLVENRGLKELLKIKTKYGFKEDTSNLSVEKAIQTDQIELSQTILRNEHIEACVPFKLDETETTKTSDQHENLVETKVEERQEAVDIKENIPPEEIQTPTSPAKLEVQINDDELKEEVVSPLTEETATN